MIVIPQQVHGCGHSFDHQRIVETRCKEGYYGRNSALLTDGGVVCIISNAELREKVNRVNFDE